MVYCKYSNQETQPFILPELPYSKDALLPHLSVESFDFHHGKHHNTYVTNLNKLLDSNPDMAGKSLEELINLSKDSNPGVFNNAAQIWNHTFFWNSMAKNGGGKPSGALMEQIEQDFGSFDAFADEFKTAAATQFGSGWAWLVFEEGRLKVMKTANAETPIAKGIKPLLNCDVWEHAYYIDYRNKRPDYVSVFLDHLANWNFASENFANCK